MLASSGSPSRLSLSHLCRASQRPFIAVASPDLVLSSSTPTTFAATPAGILVLPIWYQRCQVLRSPPRRFLHPLRRRPPPRPPPAPLPTPPSTTAAPSTSAPDPTAKALADLAHTVADLSSRFANMEARITPAPSLAASLPLVFPYGLPGYGMTAMSSPGASPTKPLPIH